MHEIVAIESLNKIYRSYKKPFQRFVDTLFSINIDREREEFPALFDLNFKIFSGETVGIIGKNGSGKSTILKIITGITTPTSGKARVNARISALLELGAGFNPEYTGIENIYLNRMIMGFTKKETDKKINEILEFAEIGGFANKPMKTYSTGMFVRLAFSTAIHTEPDLLIVDEALSVGDYRFQAKCYNKFQEFKQEGKTIILVTHDVDVVRKFCTRAMWLDKGMIREDGDVSIVTSKYMEEMTNPKEIKSVKKAADSKTKNADDKMESNSENVEKQLPTPINRFGSNVGAIIGIRCEKRGKASNVFKTGEKIKIKIFIEILNSNIDTENLAVSISAKNKLGLDLFVLSTFDFGTKINENTKEISFKFPMLLNVGEYSFAVSLENRSTNPISYYDYIDGIIYFNVFSDVDFFGIFNVPSTIEVN